MDVLAPLHCLKENIVQKVREKRHLADGKSAINAVVGTKAKQKETASLLCETQPRCRQDDIDYAARQCLRWEPQMKGADAQTEW